MCIHIISVNLFKCLLIFNLHTIKCVCQYLKLKKNSQLVQHSHFTISSIAISHLALIFLSAHTQYKHTRLMRHEFKSIAEPAGCG